MEVIARYDPDLFEVFDAVINTNNYGMLTPQRVRDLFASVLASRVHDGYISFRTARGILDNVSQKAMGGFASRGFRAVGGAMTAYLQALKKWNDKPDRWCSPRKGTPAHAEVMRLQAEAKKPATLADLTDADYEGVEITDEEIASYLQEKYPALELTLAEIEEYIDEFDPKVFGDIRESDLAKVIISDDEIAEYLADVGANVDNARELLLGLSPEDLEGVEITDAEIAEYVDELNRIDAKIAEAKAPKQRAPRKPRAPATPKPNATPKAKAPAKPKAKKKPATVGDDDVIDEEDDDPEDFARWLERGPQLTPEEEARAKAEIDSGFGEVKSPATPKLSPREIELKRFEEELDAQTKADMVGRPEGIPNVIWDASKNVELKPIYYETIKKVLAINPNTLKYPERTKLYDPDADANTDSDYLDIRKIYPIDFSQKHADVRDYMSEKLLEIASNLDTKTRNKRIRDIILLANNCQDHGISRKYAGQIHKMCKGLPAVIKSLGLSEVPKPRGKPLPVVYYYNSLIPIVELYLYEIPARPKFIKPEYHNAYYTAVITWDLFKQQQHPPSAKASACVAYVRGLLSEINSELQEKKVVYQTDPLMKETYEYAQTLPKNHAPFPNGLLNKNFQPAMHPLNTLLQTVQNIGDFTVESLYDRLVSINTMYRKASIGLRALLPQHDPAIIGVLHKIGDIAEHVRPMDIEQYRKYKYRLSKFPDAFDGLTPQEIIDAVKKLSVFIPHTFKL